MPNINEEKRARIQWNKLFEPNLYTKTEIEPQMTPIEFDGGNCWEKDDEDD
jgi:hypothetical protein